MVSNGNLFFFQGGIFRCHVSFREGISATQPKHTLSTPESSAKGISFSEKFSSIAKALFYNRQQKVHQPSSSCLKKLPEIVRCCETERKQTGYLDVVVKKTTQLRETYHTSQIETGSILLKFWSRYCKFHLEQPHRYSSKNSTDWCRFNF